MEEIELGAKPVLAERCEDKRGHFERFADIASCPAEKHLAQTLITDGDLGKNNGVGLKLDGEALFENQVGHGTVFADVGFVSEKSLVHPRSENLHYSIPAVSGQGAWGAQDRIDLALAGSNEVETEGKRNVEHFGDQALPAVEDADIACNGTDVGLCYKGAQEIPKRIFFDKRIAVDCDKDIPGAADKPFIEGFSLAAVAFETQGSDKMGMPCCGPLNPLPGIIGTSVIDGNNLEFVGRIIAGGYAVNSLGDMAAFVVSGNDDSTGRQLLICTGRGGTIKQDQSQSPNQGGYIDKEEKAHNSQVGDTPLQGGQPIKNIFDLVSLGPGTKKGYQESDKYHRLTRHIIEVIPSKKLSRKNSACHPFCIHFKPL